MEWLLIVFLRYGESNFVHEHGFRTKEECVYVGNWFVESAENMRIQRIKVKCFEVKNVQK